MSSKPKYRLHETAFAVTRWVGSLSSILTHSVAFVGSFAVAILGFLPFDLMLLVLTTIVSLEAIYLAIFIQMSINHTTASLEEVEQDIDEIQEDVEEIQEDVDEIQGDMQEMTEDEKKEAGQKKTLEEIQAGLRQLISDIEQLQKRP